MKKKTSTIAKYLFALVCILVVFSSDIQAESGTFPVYECIKPNVTFWTKIYTEYESNQGVIHDSRNLGIIYGVIKLEDPYRAGGRKINRNRIKKEKKKYKGILAKLAKKRAPKGPLENKIAAMFGPNAKPSDYKLAMRRIRCQTGQKDRFREGLIRSGAYIDEIRRIFRDTGLPEDLAYLPHVESSFNYEAYSKFGAAGIWQFTRSTGKSYMRINYSVDERRDPIRSTHAAARYLKQSYRKFNDWPMAITSYNHGTAGMLRAKRSKGSYDKIFQHYRSRLFRFASRNFYSEFIAAREAAGNYIHYFGNLELEKPTVFQEVILSGYASLPEVARHFGLELKTLRRLNPALRSSVARGKKYIPKGYSLRLPLNQDSGSSERIAKLPAELYKSFPKTGGTYTVRPGDTVAEIARLYGVKIRDVIAVNDLNARATIYVNQKLKIPGKGKAAPIMAAVKSSSEITKKTAADSPVKSVKKKVEADANSGSFTIAEKEDSISLPAGVANRQVDLASIADWWMAQDASSLPLASPDIDEAYVAVERISSHRGKKVGVIQVEVEETLGHFAEWLEVSASAIRRLNGLRYGAHVRIHQKIKIPFTRVSKEEFEEKRLEYHKGLAEDFFAAYRVEKVVPYVIKKGDNIWSLSKNQFDVPVWLIKRYNSKVDFGALTPSQKLLIPIIVKNA